DRPLAAGRRGPPLPDTAHAQGRRPGVTPRPGSGIRAQEKAGPPRWDRGHGRRCTPRTGRSDAGPLRGAPPVGGGAGGRISALPARGRAVPGGLFAAGITAFADHGPGGCPNTQAHYGTAFAFLVADLAAVRVMQAARLFPAI